MLWDPAVHEHFGERCYLYLITGRRADPTGTLSDDLRRLALSLGITSATAHALFGPYDVLFRFWGTNQSRQRFARGLKASAIQVVTIREFTASDVHYGLTATGAPSAAEISAQIDHIRAAAEAERLKPGAPVDQGVVELLLSRGLAHLIQPSVGVKFYLFLKSQLPETPPLDYTVRELRRTAQAENLQGISIYSGTGFVDLIMKAIAPNYDSLLEIVNSLRVVSKSLHFDPWSLPVADFGKAMMQETLDGVEGELGRALETLLSLEQDSARAELLRREIGSMDRRQMTALSNLAGEIYSRASGSDLERMSETLTACIAKSRKDLNRALSFLTSIEDDLRYFLPRFLAAHLGPRWLDQIRSSNLNLGINSPDALDRFTGSGPDKWTLGLMLRVLSESYVRFEGDLAADLHSIFTEGWRSHIRDIVDLRDEFAHGLLMTSVRARDFGGALGMKVRTMLIASQFQSRLEHHIDLYM